MIDHFAHGWWTPAIAYSLSVVGSFIGLRFALLARDSPARWWWLVMSATCLGGTAIWSMHFVAMLSFQVEGSPIRYDSTLTVLSGLAAVVMMALALTLATVRGTAPWLLAGGLVAGAGVVSMHYMGMASMNVHGHMHHDPVYVAIASAIAVSAATAALWFALNLRRVSTSLVAALLMGLAVSAMHYTGMFGMSFTAAEGRLQAPLPGAEATELVLPLITGMFVFLMVCSLILLLNWGGEKRPEAEQGPEAPVEEPGNFTPRQRRR